MFGREKRRFLDGKPIDTADAGTSVVGAGAVFSGDLVSGGDVVIGGEVRGSVETAARLHLTPSGMVEGSVTATDARIEGTVEGPIVVPGKLEIGDTARVMGDVRAGRLAIAEGSLVQGNLYTETAPHRFVEERRGRADGLERVDRADGDEVEVGGVDRAAGADADRVEHEERAEDAVPV